MLVKSMFEIGRLVATPGASEAVFDERLMACLQRHCALDWGEVDKEDWVSNDEAVAGGGRLLSVYRIDPDKPPIGNSRLWIITEADRSATTFLLPDEY